MDLISPKKNYPLDHKDYTLYEEVGQGVSATVYRALCIPLDEIVAIKVIDLEKCNNDMDMIRREVQTMILLDHPNLLKAHCSFTATANLWIVMPYMAAGSCLHIIKSTHPDGFEEHTIATLLYGVIKALAYLHAHGHIHRDVKAGNILVSAKGAVKLADFGVSTSLFDSGNRLQSRKTFVGTPCWMAPEVMQQLHGYDFKADIWSFGITALELAHGHAPFSKYPPMKVLLMTLQNAPPGLDYERDKRFSKSFKEIIAACLVKDQRKRPTAEKLLKHRFFKNARSNEFIVRTIVDGLGPLGDRFKMLKQKEAEFLAQTEAMHGDIEHHLSQQKYIRGISAWKFDLEDLKRQASLIRDDDGMGAEIPEWSDNQKGGFDVSPDLLERDPVNENVDSISHSRSSTYKDVNIEDLEESEAPKFRSLLPSKGNNSTDFSGNEHSDQLAHLRKSDSNKCHLHKTSSDELGLKCNGKLEVGVLDSSMKARTGISEGCDENSTYIGVFRIKIGLQIMRGTDEVWALLQYNLETPNGSTTPYFGESVDSVNSPTACVVPSLHCILQQNVIQMEATMRLIEVVDQITGNHTEFTEALTNKQQMQMSLASARERVLEAHVMSIEKRIAKLVDELQIEKMKNAKLDRHLSRG